MSSEQEQNEQSIELNKKNITLLSFAVLFLIGSIIYGLNTSQENLVAKRKRLNALSLQEVAEYIIEKNPGTIIIDPITKIRNIYFKGNTLEFPFYLSEGFLLKLNSKLESLEETKKRVMNDTIQEDCTKTAFSVFLQKGGVIHYTYRLDNDNEDNYLFDFNNTWEMCQNEKGSFL